MTYKEKAQEIAQKFSQEMIASAMSNDIVPAAGIFVSVIAIALEQEDRIAQEKIKALIKENERLKGEITEAVTGDSSGIYIIDANYQDPQYQLAQAIAYSEAVANYLKARLEEANESGNYATLLVAHQLGCDGQKRQRGSDGEGESHENPHLPLAVNIAKTFKP